MIVALLFFVFAWALVLGVAGWLGSVLTPAATAPDGAPVCEGCGYALAGLAPGSACPECGAVSRTAAERAAALRPASLSGWVLPWAVPAAVLAAATGPALWYFSGIQFDAGQSIGCIVLILHACVVVTAVCVVGAADKTAEAQLKKAGRTSPRRTVALLSLLVLTGVHAALVLWAIVEEVRNPGTSRGYERALSVLLAPVVASMAADAVFVVLGFIAAIAFTIASRRRAS